MNLPIYQETKPVSGSNWLVAAVYDPAAPTIVVAQYPFPKPYTGQTQLVDFIGLDDIVYTYICWESATTSPGGTSRNNFDIQPSNNAFTIRENLELTADVSTGLNSNTNFYNDSSLIGWDWWMERKPSGTMKSDIDFSKTISGVITGISNTNADGMKLLISGDVWGINEEIVIHFYPQASASASAPTAKLISSTTILTSNTIQDNTAIGKSFLLQGAGGYFEVTLPDLATVSDNKPIFFLSSGGSHVNVGIKCFGSQSFQWGGATVSKIWLAQNEQLMVYKFTYPDTSTKWLVAQISDTVRLVGEIVFSYSNAISNTIQMKGQYLSRANYARLWAWVQTLASSCLISDSSFDTPTLIDGVNYMENHGKFTTGDGSSTFRLPDLTASAGAGTGFLRIIDGISRIPGDWQMDSMASHQHETTAGTLPTPLFGEGAVNRLKGNYNGQATGKTDLTSIPGLIVSSTFQTTQKLSYESRPVNNGVYGLIRL